MKLFLKRLMAAFLVLAMVFPSLRQLQFYCEMSQQVVSSCCCAEMEAKKAKEERQREALEVLYAEQDSGEKVGEDDTKPKKESLVMHRLKKSSDCCALIKHDTLKKSLATEFQLDVPIAIQAVALPTLPELPEASPLVARRVLPTTAPRPPPPRRFLLHQSFLI